MRAINNWFETQASPKINWLLGIESDVHAWLASIRRRITDRSSDSIYNFDAFPLCFNLVLFPLFSFIFFTTILLARFLRIGGVKLPLGRFFRVSAAVSPHRVSFCTFSRCPSQPDDFCLYGTEMSRHKVHTIGYVQSYNVRSFFID